LLFLSTDKATNPTTIYGCSKLFLEMYIKAVDSKNTKIITTRYGNILGSNGSVLDIWKRQKDNNEPITITNPQMTRFFMSIEQALDLVLYALEYGNNKDLWVYNNKSCTIKDLADCISDNQVEIGVRCEEKNDEALLTVNELEHSVKLSFNDGVEYYSYNKKNIKMRDCDKPLRSDNAERFTKEELEALVNRS
jgi:UDP-glucose 4-epimerase